MTKEELIKKHDLNWYEQYKSRQRIYNKARYQNDLEFRETMKVRDKARYQNNSEYREYKKTMRTVLRHKYYVKDGRIDLIENYELAASDYFKGWHIHHKLELHPDGSIRFMKESLINLDLYYNRPPSELIWLRHSEHTRIHSKARCLK